MQWKKQHAKMMYEALDESELPEWPPNLYS
jgi:hypothetical protein